MTPRTGGTDEGREQERVSTERKARGGSGWLLPLLLALPYAAVIVFAALRYGARGPALMEDFHFREKIFHFDHERIPERVVHARGYGAHGYFETTASLSEYTRADIFQRGLCLPSDNKMTPDQQDVVIEIIRRCFGK